MTVGGYKEFRARLDAWRPRVTALIEAIETAPEAAVATAVADAEGSGLAWPPRLRRALVGNARKLAGVRRIKGAAYATHPTLAALYADWLVDDGAERVDAAVVALLHDYLEEGDGVTRAGYQAMLAEFSDEPLACLGAVVLCEPPLDFAIHVSGEAVRDQAAAILRDVAYAVQAEAACVAAACGGGGLGAEAGRVLATASLCDKLDNLHDLGYIHANVRLASAERIARLARKLGYYAFMRRRLGTIADPAVDAMLGEALDAVGRELGVPRSDVDGATAKLESVHAGRAAELTALIMACHAEIGVVGLCAPPSPAAT
jgi:hypothetical protein